MLTLELLRAFGADVDEGLARCMNNESFYLRLVGKAAADEGYERLRDALEAGDLAAAFEQAHALKGVLGNLSLTPLFELVSALTEQLRAREERSDYPETIARILAKHAELKALCE